MCIHIKHTDAGDIEEPDFHTRLTTVGQSDAGLGQLLTFQGTNRRIYAQYID